LQDSLVLTFTIVMGKKNAVLQSLSDNGADFGVAQEAQNYG
jgi:hypothetical protein